MSTITDDVRRLERAAVNIQRATNAAQRDAAGSFLRKRGKELSDELQTVAAWLDEADRYINANEPGINDDPDHEYNVQWIAKLREYEAASTALDSAWSAYMETLEAA